MRRSGRAPAGFSILELMFVVAIGLLIAGMAVPGIQAARQGYRIYTAGYAIAAKLRDARTNALKRNRQTWVLFDVDARSARIQTAGIGGPVDVGAPEFLMQGIVYEGMSTPTQQIAFDPLGRPISPPQVIRLRQGTTNMRRTITVLSTGRVTIE